MYPVEFQEMNRVLGSESEEFDSLPVFTDGRECISCWQMSWKERLSALLFGKVWLSVKTGDTQPPCYLQVGDTMFESESNPSCKTY